MKILLIDNYDSFTWNLAHQLQTLCKVVCVRRNDELTPDQTDGFDKILFSPGPGLPETAGRMQQIIAHCAGNKSILGICLGMQGIAIHFGARLYNMQEVMHGREERILITDRSDALFKDVPDYFPAGLYHSWAVDNKDFPDCLQVIAKSKRGVIMGIKHKFFNVKGLQFHPESIMTPYGKRIIGNWLEE